MTQLNDDQLLAAVLRGGLAPLADVPVATMGFTIFGCAKPSWRQRLLMESSQGHSTRCQET
jgi:hypothetical protein